MIEITESGDIKITKGDSAYIQFDLLNREDEPLTVKETDTVRLQVRDKQTGGRLLFEGDVILNTENSSVLWHIRPKDTAEAIPKAVYFYDSEIETEEGDVYTFVHTMKFEILPEITRKDGGDA